MLTPTQLRDFVRALEGTRVLTIYRDARVTDPAMRHAWRPALTSALRPLRAGITDARERTEFDRAAAFLSEPMPALHGIWGAPGWVAFLTATGPLYAGELPVRPPTYIVWRDGPAIAPYLRALKQRRPVIVTLVDSRSVRFYRYAWGTLTPLPEQALVTENGIEGHVPPSSSSSRPAHPAARGLVGGERARRRQRTAFLRLMTPFCDRLIALAGTDGWVLIGGTPEWARLAAETLPTGLAARATVSATLDHDAPEAEIVREAKRAATELRARHGQALIHRLADQRGAVERAAIGMPAVQRALLARAVDVLLISPEFLRVHAHLVEDVARAALLQGGDVEVLSGSAADVLDEASGGIAARLRFPIDAPAPVDARTAWTEPRAPTPRAG